jgi:LAGLIDADG-like domain
VVRRDPRGKCVDLSLYSAHLPCLFPQHAPGRKHERPIQLEAWQSALVELAPWPFLRGCIRSDGCVFVNRTDVHRPQPYEYLSYQFANMSKGIIDLFMETCDLVGVVTRINRNRKGLWTVRINQRESVERLYEHVGPKL